MVRALGMLAVVATAAVGALAIAGVDPARAGVAELPESACEELQYGGPGTPEAIVVTDLPRHGASRERTLQMEQAVRLRLRAAGWRAGDIRVGLQRCDDSSARSGSWEPSLCRRNARAYAANPAVLGVIGTYNSGCAQVMLPILNRAPGGGVPMLSPGNTLVCLTVSAATCASNEPRRYFPTGRRTYARVVPNDAYQGAALATFTRDRLRARRVAVLEAAGDPTSHGQAMAFRGAAGELGLAVVATGRWDPEGSSFRSLMRRIAAARPDAVVLAGLTEQQGGRVIRDKVAVMGSNRGPVRLLAFDGFAQNSTLSEAGRAARGMYASVPGRAPSRLDTASGRRLVRQLRRRFPRQTVELFAPYAGQAADVLLGAIERGNGRRRAIASAMLRTNVRNGIVGDFRITSTGDPQPGVITVNIAAARSFRPTREVSPSRQAVRGALAGPVALTG